jgi:hypothetical protein
MTAKNPSERYSDPAEVAAALAPFAQGHELTKLVRGMFLGRASAQTQVGAKSDTRIAKSAESDTMARTSAGWSGLSRITEQTRRKLLRIGGALMTLAAVVAIGWLAILATGRQESAQDAIEARQRALKVAAQFASSEILKEINRRFDILKTLAKDSELQQQMVRINEKPNDESLWKPLSNLLGAHKSDNDRETPSDSWFINDWRGVQVARSPRSDTSGETFSHRDYFHGQGKELPPDTKDLEPISAPHLSAVYRSTSTKRLKVAFSVPIENGRKGKERQVVGVLAMSVDLGAFNVLEKRLPQGLEVVLLDLRESTLSAPPRRGLILHHQREEAFSKDAPTPWLGAKMLARIDKTLKTVDLESAEDSPILENYRDEALTNGKFYVGALQPLVDRRPDEPVRDSRWVVLVQEPVSE